MPDGLARARLGTQALPECPLRSCGAGGDECPGLHHPCCNRALQPHVGCDTCWLVDAALGCLVSWRGGSLGDPGAELSCLASLVAETQSRLPDAVTSAVELGYSWAEVAGKLAIAPSTARRRYEGYAAWRLRPGSPEEG